MMNRAEFMSQLESLLRNIAPTEREEAIQYYNDYFDDAGKENEQAVIEALGNPARVAENIRRDFLDSGYGKKPAENVQASDRVLVKYGQESGGTSEGRNDGVSGGAFEKGKESAGQGWNPFQGYGKSADGTPPDESAYRWDHDTAGWFGKAPEKQGRKGIPAWMIVLLAVALIFASPVLGGLFSGILGVLVFWFAAIVCFGVAAVCLFAVFLGLAALGIVCFFGSPWAGLALIGGGLLAGCVGILFLMLTVAMAGIVTPAIFRSISALFRFCKEKKTAWAAG